MRTSAPPARDDPRRTGREGEPIPVRIREGAAPIQGDVTNDKAGKFAMFADPDGNPCYLYQMTPSYAPR